MTTIEAAYDFFLSYARDDDSGYMRKFFSELNEAVRARRGKRGNESCGFFDQSRIELGADWGESISSALQTSRTLICAYSPTYFRSEYCGKEVSVFLERVKLHIKLQAAEAKEATLPVIKPILWEERKYISAPSSMQHIQYSIGPIDAPQNVIGIRQLRHIGKHRDRYRGFIETLAGDIVSSADRYPLPPLPYRPSLQSNTASFGGIDDSISLGNSLQNTERSGPKYVDFYFVAASPSELNHGNVLKLEAYLEEGGPDWKPYFPACTQPIGALAQNVAGENGLSFLSSPMAFTERLTDAVRVAEQKGRIVLIFLDPWSLSISKYADAILDLDRQNYFNCCILVPCYNAGAESNEYQINVGNKLSSYLPHRTAFPNTLYFRSLITSEEQLKAVIREVLGRLRCHLLERAPVIRQVPTGPAQPMIHGPV